MNKKYEITDIEHPRIRKCFRIRALFDFSDVKAGDIGGYVESEDNLSQNGDCWIYGDACVYDDARVCDDARVNDDARVHGNARVSGNAMVLDEAQVFKGATVCGNAILLDQAHVLGYRTFVHGLAVLHGEAYIDHSSSYVIFQNVGSENGILTAFKDVLGRVRIKRGCFAGTLEEFADAVEVRHGGYRYGREYRLLIEFIRIRLGVVN